MSFLKNKSILVTGGAGFVGTNLIRALLPLGCHISATFNRRLPRIVDSGIDFVRGDLTDRNFCRNAVKGIDYVFMCAANSSGASVMEEKPLTHVTPNVIMNSLMLEAAYEAGVKKFLFISSTTVYPLSDSPVKECDLLTAPVFDKYFCVAWMKIFSEKLCEMYAKKIKKPMPVIIIRSGNLYGPEDDFEWETSHALPALMRRAVERHDPLVIWGDGREVKDLIYIDDFIDGMLLAMEKIQDFDIINVASGEPTSLRNALNWILRYADYEDANVEYDLSKPQMMPWRMVDISKAKEVLGFQPKVSLAEGIKRTIDWYKKKK